MVEYVEFFGFNVGDQCDDVGFGVSGNDLWCYGNGNYVGLNGYWW